MRETLLVAEFDAAQIEHTVLHRTDHALSPPGLLALKESGHDPEGQVQAGP